MAAFTSEQMGTTSYSSKVSAGLGASILGAVAQITQALNNRPTLGGGFTASDTISDGKLWGNSSLRIQVDGPIGSGWGAPVGLPQTPTYRLDITTNNADGFQQKVAEIKNVLQTTSNAPAGAGRRRKSKKVLRRRRTTRKH
jgi:hypothetical protein